MIELLIVLSIIMILAAISLTTYRNSVTLAKEAALRSDLLMMREAIDQYYADKGKYPDTLQALVSDSYLRAVPKDPFTDVHRFVADGRGRAAARIEHARSPASTT